MIVRKNKKLILDINAIALPLILSTISSIVMGIVDQSLVGHISIYAYAGVGLVASSISSITGVLGAISIAFNIKGSKYKGTGDSISLNDLFTSSIVLSFLIGIILFITINIFCDFILNSVFGLKDIILKEATNYIRIYSLSILLNLLIFIHSSVFKIFRKTSHIFKTTIIVNIINIGLDYALIFGKFGLPKLGTMGAAVGTIIALLLNLIIYIIIAKKLVTFDFKVCLIKKKLIGLFTFSMPFIGQEFLEDVIFVIGLNAVIARIGVIELSTYTLILQLISVMLMPMFGYSTANLSLVSESYGRKDFTSCITISKIIACILVIIHIIVWIGVICTNNILPQLITSDQKLIEFAVKVIPIAIFIQLFNYIMSTYKSSLQAVHMQSWVLKVTFIINVVVFLFILLFAENLYLVYLYLGFGYLINSIIFYRKYNNTIKGLMG